jgi:GTP-binding protein
MRNIEFVKAIYSLNELPKKELPTVVLAGRSNVGKSSFINSIFYPLNVAKTSSTPGKTRSINYYLVENKFYIVDLPGFGYAKVSKTERDKWQSLIEQYFYRCNSIALIFHLIDSRHEPTALDRQLQQYLMNKALPYNIVLNKIDKLKQSEIAKAKKKIRTLMPQLVLGENLFLFSTVTGYGKKEIINRISSLLL